MRPFPKRVTYLLPRMYDSGISLSCVVWLDDRLRVVPKGLCCARDDGIGWLNREQTMESYMF